MSESDMPHGSRATHLGVQMWDEASRGRESDHQKRFLTAEHHAEESFPAAKPSEPERVWIASSRNDHAVADNAACTNYAGRTGNH